MKSLPCLVAGLIAIAAGTAAADQSWVLFGTVQGVRNVCEPSYDWVVEPFFHNTSTSSRDVQLLHQSVPLGLPAAITIEAGESLPLSALVAGPPLGISVIQIDSPAEVVVQSRLQIRNVQPCVSIPPPLGPFGAIPFPVFRLLDAQQPQHHYDVDMGIQSVRLNAGIYNGGSATAVATIDVERPWCGTTATTVITIPPDSLLQTTVSAPPICNAPVHPRVPFWILNATVTVDQPSFSYVSNVSNVLPPTVTFALGSP